MREKQRLAKLIVKTRKDMDLSQAAALAKKLGISQARVAQIESGVDTARVTFDVLFKKLKRLVRRTLPHEYPIEFLAFFARLTYSHLVTCARSRFVAQPLNETMKNVILEWIPDRQERAGVTTALIGIHVE